MIVISEEYDEVMRMLHAGSNLAFVPVDDGAFQSIYTPATSGAVKAARRNPIRFAYAACKKTREYARDQGYEVL